MADTQEVKMADTLAYGRSQVSYGQGRQELDPTEANSFKVMVLCRYVVLSQALPSLLTFCCFCF